MNIHEYQAKEILRQYGIKVPNGSVVFSVDEAVDIAEMLRSERVVVKAQIYAGGRGSAGGVKIANNLQETRKYAHEILGKVLITKQTGSSGKVVRRLLIEEASDIEHEYYIGLILDRETSKVRIICSKSGGMDIEDVAKTSPNEIISEEIDCNLGLTAYQARRLIFKLNIPKQYINEAVPFFETLYKIFIEKDCSILEINPLVTTRDSGILALDAKMSFDDNALFRQREIAQLRDPNEEDEKEIEAAKSDLSYIALDGNIGCMVNGAGLAMATMDIIKYYGGSPANFLDVGGGATSDKVTKAFKIILADKNVKGVFVNIFGGIMKCDIIADGIVTAIKTVSTDVPIVVRLEGTNVSLGKEILEKSGLNIEFADSMAHGARKIVSLVREV